jgi:DNA invertase Pin-like site-specific DNA recombinase
MSEFIQYNISPTNFYVYTRVSSNQQATDSNHGLDSQILICENYLKSIFEFNDQQIESVVDYYTDIGSSYSNPKALHQLNLLFKKLKNDSLILISEISRLGRNVRQVINMLKTIEDKNCWIISVTEGLCFNKSKLMNKQFYQKIIDAERESDLISIRTTNAYKVIKEKGGFIGRAPFGKKKVINNGITTIVDNIDEINIIKIGLMDKNSREKT